MRLYQSVGREKEQFGPEMRMVVVVVFEDEMEWQFGYERAQDGSGI